LIFDLLTTYSGVLPDTPTQPVAKSKIKRNGV
jgi:hypothetical protein